MMTLSASSRGEQKKEHQRRDKFVIDIECELIAIVDFNSRHEKQDDGNKKQNAPGGERACSGAPRKIV